MMERYMYTKVAAPTLVQFSKELPTYVIVLTIQLADHSLLVKLCLEITCRLAQKVDWNQFRWMDWMLGVWVQQGTSMCWTLLPS